MKGKPGLKYLENILMEKELLIAQNEHFEKSYDQMVSEIHGDLSSDPTIDYDKEYEQEIFQEKVEELDSNINRAKKETRQLKKEVVFVRALLRA